MKIACIGSGYVGSVTGTSFALFGHTTTIIDIDEAKVRTINEGKSPIYEPGLEGLITYAVKQGSLQATLSYDCIAEADVIFIGVGTPSKHDGTADLTYVKAAAASIGQAMERGADKTTHKFKVIVNKSTVPVGTADIVASIVERESGCIHGIDFAVVSNPEFLREGFAVEDVFFPDRIVIGTDNEQARKKMQDVYDCIIQRQGYEVLLEQIPEIRSLMQKTKPVYFETDTKSSELIKYASNAFLAVKISYINEMAMLSERVGANVLEVAKGMGLDSRIGEKFLEVSSGWSGSCFPKDTAELAMTAKSYKRDLSIVQAAMQANTTMHTYVVEKMINKVKSLNGKNIGILGLTFKPNTDDARKTQAGSIIEMLLDLGANVRVHDPQGMEMFEKYHQGLSAYIAYTECGEEVAERADCVLLLTHWQEYMGLDWEYMHQRVRNPYILDTRNFLDREQLVRIGFDYEGLGV